MKTEEILAELKVAKERIEFLEKELNKPTKFEFKYKKNETYCMYKNTIKVCMDGTDTDGLKHGLYRIKKENAIVDIQLNKESNLIGAIAEQIDVDYAKNIDWNNEYNMKYYVAYNNEDKRYIHLKNYTIRILGIVYMSEKVAKKVCEILNNKEVEL